MYLSQMFKNSARELKNPRCLTTTGILIAMYVVMNAFIRIEPFEGVKMTFNYLPLSVIGMFFGPVVSAVAAIPCDIIAPLFEGKAVSPWLMPSRIAEGFIYGLFLYNLKFVKDKKQTIAGIIKIIMARMLVMALCYMVYNTTVLYYIFGMNSELYNAFFYTRLIKNLIQFPIDLFLMFTLLPTIYLAYIKVFRSIIIRSIKGRHNS